MNKFSKVQTGIEHEKLKYSLIRKAYDGILQTFYDIRSSAAKILSSKQIEQVQNEISALSEKLQELYYQNTRNELLAKGQKTEMELTHVTVVNGALKNGIINQINCLISHIQHLATQLQHQNNQLWVENNENSLAAMPQQEHFELQISKLNLEK
jgi:hypothetical protein